MKISTPPTVSNVFATLMPNHNQQETSGSGKSLHDEVGLSGTQIPFHVINTLSIGSVLSVQSQLLHRLLLQNVYGSPSFDFNTLPSRAHLPDNDCDLLNHMTLLRQIMLLGSGEIVVSLEDMILGKDLSSFLAGFPQLAQLHSVINFDETESAKFGPLDLSIYVLIHIFTLKMILWMVIRDQSGLLLLHMFIMLFLTV